MEDRAKSLKHKTEREARKLLLDQRHIRPLVEFVNAIKNEQHERSVEVPYFDPLDGGVEAQCLYVLEAPGPKARESGFVSRNNNDLTAENGFVFNEMVGIERGQTIIWNIVPWYIGTGRKIRAATTRDIEQGLPYLLRLIDMLSRLRVIVLVGRKAQKVEKDLRLQVCDIDILHCFHWSPRHINPDKMNNTRVVLDQLRQVKRALNAMPITNT